MLSFLSKILALLPLSAVHYLGKVLGWFIHLCTPASSKIQGENLTQSALFNSKANLESTLKANVGETG